MVASPVWLTMAETPDYLIFGNAFVLGILLIILGHLW